MAEEKKKIQNVTIETYANDMASVIGDNQNGLVKKIIEEEEKHNASKKKGLTENEKNRIFLFVGIFFVLLAFIAISIVFFFKKDIFTVEVKPQYVPIIFTDKTEFKEVSGLKKDEIIQTILNEAKNAEFKKDGVEGIYLSYDKKVIGFRKLLELLEFNLDKTKIEFINDNFLVGAKDNGTDIALPVDGQASLRNRDLFILLKMRSITDIFPPMRLWENKMFYDFHKFFGVELNIDTKYLLEKSFEDGIVQNKNARILRDSDGKLIMMYVFAEEDSLIITNSDSAAKEVMLRLTSSSVKK
jgi:hypothetical protein